ncbi:MAG: LysM peptidoglycan-binding domain-containing protein [Aggregatilineales bacterium]
MMALRLLLSCAGCLLAWKALSACVPTRPVYIVVTATSTPLAVLSPTPALYEHLGAPAGFTPEVMKVTPTPNPTRPEQTADTREYIVRPGDTLSSIASAYNVSLATLIEANAITNPDLLVVGQVVRIPSVASDTTPALKIIPDSRLVRGPGAALFDVDEFVKRQDGFIRAAVDVVNGRTLTASQVIEQVSLEFSVDPRLLLALLELRANWLTDANPSETLRIYPLGAPASPLGFDRNGLYRQLAWAADRMNMGYYGWKYRNLDAFAFDSGERLRFGAGLNAGTIGVQYMLSLHNTKEKWLREIGPNGLYAVYAAFFGDPFAATLDVLVPPGLEQPALTLPFQAEEQWFFTGGPHGGWGSGSAWSAIDFAPPDDIAQVSSVCYRSAHAVTAVASGIITRSADGVVILDLDADGDDTTGWSILYLHIDSEGRVKAGSQVKTGDVIGYPSCEGGVSNGTHVHLARRYNGEWIPADCSGCSPDSNAPQLVLGGWAVYGLTGQEYQGYLLRNNERRIAEQGRLSKDNLVSW